MTRTRAATTAGIALLAIALYLLPIPRRGLVGPDEPRYASIARQMAESGDWITPNLWGEAWFEKPSMLFWLGGIGHSVGLDAYTRMPVALLCLGFLGFFLWRVRASFGTEIAVTATCVLATSGGWIAYADAGIFDAPLAVFVSAALLCLLPWVRLGDGGTWFELAAFGALLGLGVLSKGLVAPIIAAAAVLPVLLARPKGLLKLIGPVPLGAFALACLPWYGACYWVNGQVFFEEFIIKHHFERFFSPSLQHVQPWWFYVPVLAAFLLPWTPLLASLRWDTLTGGPRRRFLVCWALLPLLLFSAGVNKLPSYVLPILPPLAILVAIQWKSTGSRALLLCAAATLLLVPLAGTLLPPALADGIRRAWAALDSASLAGGIAAGVAIAGLAAAAALKAPRPHALPLISAIAALALAALKFQAYPAISAQAGTREFVASESQRIQLACIGEVRRHAAYGIRHYTLDTVPACEQAPASLRIEGDPLSVVRNTSGVKAGAEPGADD